MTSEERAQVIGVYAQMLKDNLGNRLTVALINGLLVALDQTLPVVGVAPTTDKPE